MHASMDIDHAITLILTWAIGNTAQVDNESLTKVCNIRLLKIRQNISITAYLIDKTIDQTFNTLLAEVVCRPVLGKSCIRRELYLYSQGYV